ncbi:hypothetical protein ACFC1R_03440 [Kitasatospora sp. NPDC056138]|uniref:hypothetical protein n=1 Tax=Kitasatospora sp. NPDC056138 TaxID=3345724 RepID=UPI0035D7CBBE
MEYYDRLDFGNPAPPFATDSPVNPASLREYFRENSNGRFWFDRIAVAGPIQLGEYAKLDGIRIPETRSAGCGMRSGVSDVGGFGHIVFGVDATSNLR